MKTKLLRVPLSEELYDAAFQIALRKGFDSVQQVVRLLLTAFADGELQPYYTIDIAKKKTDAEIKLLRERDEFEKQMNEQVLRDAEEALNSYRSQQAYIWSQEKHAE